MTLFTVTDAAKAHLIRMMKQANRNCLTVSLTKTGCNGFSFDYKFKMGAPGSAYTDLAPEGDPETGYTYDFYIDADSLPMMMGVVIDYVKDGFNSKLTYDLPLAKGSCGCGESFNF